MSLPCLFLSHGSPMLALSDSPASRALHELGQTLPRPRAILVISAHWESSPDWAVSLTPEPATLHDFGGFPKTLYTLDYPAPGAPETAEQAARLLEQAGLQVERSHSRGLDHGAWVPLRLLYPHADIPVAQLSLRHGASPQECLAVGQALQPLREQGVLLLASGALTHNLAAFRGAELASAAPVWVRTFAEWMQQQLAAGDLPALLDYRAQGPFAKENHPSEEHLLPLFVALGAGGDAPQVDCLHQSYEYGILAMDMYAFR